jgi:hypothetical protein
VAFLDRRSENANRAGDLQAVRPSRLVDEEKPGIYLPGQQYGRTLAWIKVLQ